jgi:hypothetical protein
MAAAVTGTIKRLVTDKGLQGGSVPKWARVPGLRTKHPRRMDRSKLRPSRGGPIFTKLGGQGQMFPPVAALVFAR